MNNRNKHKNFRKDIDDKIYKNYIKFVKNIQRELPNKVNLQFRFSGGEPLVLGDRLFHLVDYGYQETGIDPYILTNGLAITQKWIKKAKAHHIKYLFVSIENPLNPDPTAPNPRKIINKIKKFNSKKLPIIPGVTIVKNENFKLLYDTCKYFYNKLGHIPAISELNFQAFQIPTKQEYNDLYINVKKVVKKFHGKTQLVLFPYISPELSYSGKKQYLLELDINDNKYHLTQKQSINKHIAKMLNQIKESYPPSFCKKQNCDWFEFCQNYKWVWNTSFNNMPLNKKQLAYCRLKKTINQAFYDA